MFIADQSTIAKQLLINQTIVSKGLRDADDISAEMKKCVRYMVEKMNYIPHYHTKSLHPITTKKNQNELGAMTP